MSRYDIITGKKPPVIEKPKPKATKASSGVSTQDILSNMSLLNRLNGVSIPMGAVDFNVSISATAHGTEAQVNLSFTCTSDQAHAFFKTPPEIHTTKESNPWI